MRIKEAEKDALRFHWKRDDLSELEVLRFTRALFGLTSSPFLLGGVIDCHLETREAKMPELVAELRRNLYVDVLLSGGATVQEAQFRKENAIEIFEDARFTLHKWHSNVPQLEGNIESNDSETTFAKQQLQPPEGSRASLLGLEWDKDKDELSVKFPTEETELTKKGVLRKLAKVYDPLGLVSPVTLEAKLIFRDVCDEKQPWDAKLKEPLAQRWKKWEQSLPLRQLVPRSIASYQGPLQEIELHAFGDGSKQSVGAAVYAIVRQQSGTTQRLVAAKARLAKGGLSIPRLELVAAHMGTNLITNVKNALEGLPVSKKYVWLDSTVVLYWISGRGEYKQFVQNRVTKIKEHENIVWRHVSSDENPADLASRGGLVSESSLWWCGPKWLSKEEKWPPNPVTSASPATEVEAKTVREALKVAQTKSTSDDLDKLLEKHELWRALRVGAWIVRFVRNARVNREKRVKGPLTTEEIESQRMFWIRRAQRQAGSTRNYERDRLHLNVQTNQDGVLECRGRIQGSYPIYLDDTTVYTRKLVERSHLDTLHGGVTLTTANVRERHWVPRLRKLTKQVIKSCAGCKRFQAIALSNPPPGPLPLDRTQGNTPFDFAGPLKYRIRSKTEGKAYIALYSCSLTRAVYLDET